MSRTVLTRGTVVIDVAACKGCDLCIPACPPAVLEMTTTEVNGNGFRYPQLFPGCTGCRACADVCPDFCFEVLKYDTPVEETVPDRADPPISPISPISKTDAR